MLFPFIHTCRTPASSTNLSCRSSFPLITAILARLNLTKSHSKNMFGLVFIMTASLFASNLIHSYCTHFTSLSAPLRLFLLYNLRSLSRGWLLCQLRMPISISNPLRRKQQPLSSFSKSLPSHFQRSRLWTFMHPFHIVSSFSLLCITPTKQNPTVRAGGVPRPHINPELPAAVSLPSWQPLWMHLKWWSCFQQVLSFFCKSPWDVTGPSCIFLWWHHG